MYKFVAIDLDGTMLNQYGVVTERTKLAIQKIKEKGINVVIASGRPIDSIKSIAKEIGADHYFIAGNGALIYDMEKDKILYEKYMDKQKILEIIRLCEENSISYNIYTQTTIIAKALKYNVLYYHKENLKKEENKRTKITIVDDVEDYVIHLPEEKFLKMTICDESKVVFQSIIRKLRQIQGIEVLDVLHMSRKMIRQGTEEVPIEYHYTEISSQQVDKWYAIEFLLGNLSLSAKETMAIGDNMNDKKMIEQAGLGIAMAGSTPQITNVADYITDTNQEDGVAKALEKFCLNLP